MAKTLRMRRCGTCEGQYLVISKYTNCEKECPSCSRLGGRSYSDYNREYNQVKREV